MENALVSYVLGAKPSFGMVKRFVERTWKNMGVVEVYLLGSGVFIFDFDDSDIETKVLEQGPWSFNSRPLILKPWTPEVSLEREGVSTIPIWVRLPNLKLHLWSEVLLSKLVSFIGTPLFSDKMTAQQERLSFARVCVEIQVDKELPSYIPVFGPNGSFFKQDIEYEWVPHSCTSCKVFGHNIHDCPKMPKKAKATKQWVEKEKEKAPTNLSEAKREEATATTEADRPEQPSVAETNAFPEETGQVTVVSSLVTSPNAEVHSLDSTFDRIQCTENSFSILSKSDYESIEEEELLTDSSPGTLPLVSKLKHIDEIEHQIVLGGGLRAKKKKKSASKGGTRVVEKRTIKGRPISHPTL